MDVLESTVRLCKQGVDGSILATSTNFLVDRKVPSTFSSAGVYSRQGSRHRYAVISTLHKPEILTLAATLFSLTTIGRK